MDNPSTNLISFSDFVAVGSLIVAAIALFKSSQTSKIFFLNTLRENAKTAKHKILELEVKDYENIEKIRIIDTLHDLTLYQGYKKEKNKYLNKEQNDYLSNLYEEIEDKTGCILIDCDVNTNKQQIKESINNFLNLL